MIYDCFTFYNELDMLEIRLNTLNDIVDKFILVEMNKTHMGIDKPFIFDENKNKFNKFLHKIIHIKVEACPVSDYSEQDTYGNRWFLECYQRDKIMEGLKDANDDDIIIISDLDEIPNPECIKNYKSGIKIFEQKNFYYFLNYLNISDPILRWGSKICHFSDLKDPKIILEYNPRYSSSKYGMPTYLRCCTHNPNIELIPNGGWHFSFAMDIDKMILKRKSIVEQQYNTEKNMNYDYIKKQIEEGRDLFGREYEYEAIKIDKTFPKYIFDNQEKYSKLIFPYSKSYSYIKKPFKKLNRMFKNIFSIYTTFDCLIEKRIIQILGLKISYKIYHDCLTVVIPTMLKDEKILNNLVKILLKDKCIKEIIIINNSSKYYTYENNKVKIISPSENIYVNPAWNLGINEAQTNLIALINDDLNIPKNLCQNIIPFILRNDMGLIGMSTKSVRNTGKKILKKTPKSGKIKLIPIDKLSYNFGTIMFFNKQNFINIPEKLKIYYGDNWLLEIMKRQNKKNFAIKGPKILHFGSMSSNTYSYVMEKEEKEYLKSLENLNKEFRK